MQKKSVCIITSAHLSYNPRTLKEADALHEAGYQVRVVAIINDDKKKELDDDLMQSRKWRLERLDVRKARFASKLTWLWASFRQRFFGIKAVSTVHPLGDVYAYCRYFTELKRFVCREAADLYIAHNLPALPVAAQAAKLWGTKLGFDAEDFHRGEFYNIPENARLIELTKAIEEKYIPQCDYLTAASDGIGAAYADALGIHQPPTILNTFPLSDRSGHVPEEELRTERKGEGLSLYWYSQVIGPDRGLEDVLHAISLIDGTVQFHIRGDWAPGYEEIFMRLADKLGVKDCIHILPPAPPEQLVERAAMHDIGLVLEIGETVNRKICVTNKILVYLLAGLAIISTDTLGHKAILHLKRDLGILYKPGDYHQLSKQLKIWIDKPDLISKAKEIAKKLAETSLCWDIEKTKLVKIVTLVLTNTP